MENTIVDTIGDELHRIGQLGESHFLHLCLRAKLKGSKVEPDKTDKDFIVETALELLVSVDRHVHRRNAQGSKMAPWDKQWPLPTSAAWSSETL